jgi:hypothetical protein
MAKTRIALLAEGTKNPGEFADYDEVSESSSNALLVAKPLKRLNRKKLITQFEEMRQGFRDMRDLAGLTPLQRITPEALHKYADMIIVELGGESVLGN